MFLLANNMGVNSLKPGSSQFSSAVLQQVYKVQRKSLIIQLAHGSASGTEHSLEMFGRSLRLLQRGRLRQEVADLQGQNVSSERRTSHGSANGWSSELQRYILAEKKNTGWDHSRSYRKKLTILVLVVLQVSSLDSRRKFTFYRGKGDIFRTLASGQQFHSAKPPSQIFPNHS